MRIARKLLLVALAVSAMMAIGVGTAGAASVSNEANGAACTSISETGVGATPSKTEITGTCPIEGESVGEMELGGPFGVMILCPVYMEGQVNGAGHAMAAIFKVGNNDRTASNPSATETCSQNWAVPCAGPAGEVHPELAITSTITNSTKWAIEGEFCVKTHLGTTVDCHVPGVINEIPNTHKYELVFSGTAGGHNGAACEDNAGYSLQGTLQLTPADANHIAPEISG
jgi:hypothetical protein